MSHILFDLDGTLTDSREGIIRCIEHALVTLGRNPPPEAQLLHCVGPPLSTSFAALLGTADEAMIRRALSAYRDRFESIGMFENAVYPDVPDALRLLATNGHSLHLVTAKPARYAERILHHFSLHTWFQSVIGPDLSEVAYTKSLLVGRALKVGALDPAGAVMVGDRAEDIEAARAHEVASIGVTWGYGSLAELEAAAPDHLVSSVAELLALLSRP